MLSQDSRVYVCPHCKSPAFIKYGKEEGIQRYRCKSCNKTFRASTGTSIHQLHKKDLVEKYIKALQDGLSVRSAAVKVGISKGTSFAWRHKFLASLTKTVQIEEKKEIGGKGSAVIRMTYSDKGRKKPPEKIAKDSVSLMIIDGNNTFIKPLNPYRPIRNASEILMSLHADTYIANVPDRILSSALNKSSLTCISRKTQAYKQFQHDLDSKLNQLAEWMERFQGVATKYLHHYWSWFSAMENIKGSICSEEMFIDLCINPQSRKEYFITRTI